ncbi:MAG: hypothetical protein VCB78_09660, partial [Myxococcota bacterium]
MMSSTTTIKSTRSWTTWLLLAVVPFLALTLLSDEASAQECADGGTDSTICGSNSAGANGTESLVIGEAGTTANDVDNATAV